MRRFLLCTLGCFILGGRTVEADGLLYKLPEDGAWAQFELKITHDKESPRTEPVIMRSVGRVGGDSRWLEFKLPQEESTETIKLLIPERFLTEGESPMEHIIRAWSKKGDDLPVALPRVRDFWLLVFLAGPLDRVTKLERVELDTPLGKIQCEGLKGHAHVREDDGYEEELTYWIRRHMDAPFGVVACRIECLVKHGGKQVGAVTYELRLTNVGKNAESELKEYE